MKKNEIFTSICVAYTLISLLNVTLHLLAGERMIPAHNGLMMFLWTGIAVLVLSIHFYFERWSPVVMIVCQYVLALAMVMGSVWIWGLFTILHPDAYRDAWISFSIPYVIGAVIYYIDVFRSAHRQNQWIQEIRLKK